MPEALLTIAAPTARPAHYLRKVVGRGAGASGVTQRQQNTFGGLR